MTGPDGPGQSHQPPDPAAFLAAGRNDEVSRYPGRLRVRKRTGLTPEERTIEARFAAQIEGDLEGHVARYRKAAGNTLNTDRAKELSAEYAGSPEGRARSVNAVYEPARALIEHLYRQLLREPPEPGQDAHVIFLAGGAGAGKSSSLVADPGMAGVVGRAQVVVDGTLSDRRAAEAMLEEALKAGRLATIIYVHRPIEKATEGVIERMLEPTGWPVSEERIARLHFDAQRTFLHLAQRYHGRVALTVIDNSGEPGKAHLSGLEELSRIRYSSYQEVLTLVRETIDREYERRRGIPTAIPDALYRYITRARRAGARVRHGDDPEPPRAGEEEA
jgi:hypothetical protein